MIVGLAVRSLTEPFVLRLSTRPNDFDRLGHVNHAVVLEYLEAARVRWLASLGLTPNGEILAVVMRVEVDYRREIFAGDLVVRTRLVKGAEEISYRATFHQVIEVAGGDDAITAVDARIDVAFIDAASRNLCTFQDFLEASAH